MKKNFKYALMSAIAFAGAVSFSACSSSDEIADNPNYDPETNTVKTEFAININHPGNSTRMTAANTQQDGDFLGMTDMYLFSTASPSTDFITTGKFALGSLASTDITASKSSKVYTMYVPVTTNNFLFYAKNGITGATAAQKGSLTYNVSTAATKPSDISFSLNPIVVSSTEEASKVTEPETALAGYMNTIENTTGWAGTVTTVATDISYKGLSDAYQEFTRLSTRQGSSAAILRQVQDLYRVMAGISSNNSGGVKDIADAVITNIGTAFTVSSGSGTSAVLAFTSTDNNVINFPAEAGLPAGSAVLLYDKSSTATAGSKFSYAGFRSNAIFGETPSTDMGNINTPAELVYYDNSPLRTSTQSLTVSDFVSSTPANWEEDAQWTALGKGWTTGTDAVEVTSATRAVAMKYNIKYGVALLATQVKLGSGLTSNQLTDNRKAIVTSEENQTDIDGTKLQLTGLIIGGQPASANWQFLPASTSFNQTIYDPITPVSLSTTATDANYTLVLDNYNSSEVADVNIALEFLNDNKDFYGRDGLIAKGQKFYLVGKLKGDATNATNSLPTTWPAGIPQSGNARVFIQDFKTTAVFTIDNGDSTADPARVPSLQNAYSVIPDLRSTEMVFGLSVNLQWTPGLTYNISL